MFDIKKEKTDLETRMEERKNEIVGMLKGKKIELKVKLFAYNIEKYVVDLINDICKKSSFESVSTLFEYSIDELARLFSDRFKLFPVYISSTETRKVANLKEIYNEYCDNANIKNAFLDYVACNMIFDYGKDKGADMALLLARLFPSSYLTPYTPMQYKKYNDAEKYMTFYNAYVDLLKSTDSLSNEKLDIECFPYDENTRVPLKDVLERAKKDVDAGQLEKK